MNFQELPEGVRRQKLNGDPHPVVDLRFQEKELQCRGRCFP